MSLLKAIIFKVSRLVLLEDLLFNSWYPFIIWKSITLYIVIWNLKIYFWGSLIRVGLKLLISEVEHTKQTSSILTYKVDFIGLQKLWWASGIHQQLICGLLDAFYMNCMLVSLFSQGKMRKNKYSALWKLRVFHQGPW